MNNPEYEPERVTSVEHLRQLARDGRSCYRSYSNYCSPAAFFLNMQASLLLHWIDNGILYIYPKRKQKKGGSNVR